MRHPKVIAVLVLGVLAFFFSVAVAISAPPVTYHRAEVLEIHDGDTLKASIVVDVIGVRTEPELIRSDFDCWEVSRSRNSAAFKGWTDEQWKAEIARGIEAREALRQLLDRHMLYVSPTKQPETYGRKVLRWWAYDPKTDKLFEVGQWMRERGHLR